MNVKFETEKRLKIISQIKDNLKSSIIGILVGGSMGFGQYFSIKKDSDIDTVVVIERKNVIQLVSNDFFKDLISAEVIDLFKKNIINFFWITKIINNVEVNFFIYDKESYINFCLFRENLKGFINFKPSEFQSGFGFDGKKIKFNRKIEKFGNGYLYEKPTLANGKYWGGVPRQDFFYSGYVVCEKDNFFTNLEKEVWEITINKLKLEFGNSIDLTKFNILNTHYTYQKEPERLPLEVFEKIKNRTKKELEKIS